MILRVLSIIAGLGTFNACSTQHAPGRAEASLAGAPSAASATADRFKVLAREERSEEFATLLDRRLREDLAVDSLSMGLPALDLPRVRASLPRTTAILGMLPQGDAVFSALITDRGARALVLDAPAARVMAARLHAWMKDPAGRPFDRHAAHELYRELIDPWSRWLRASTRLVVVPGGFLRGIPFETCLMIESEDLEESSVPYLKRRFDITYEPTLGSRLLWAVRDSPASLVRVDGAVFETGESTDFRGALVTAGDLDPAGRFRFAFAAAKRGAHGALLGWGSVGSASFDLVPSLERFRSGLDGGRRSDVAALRTIHRAPEDAMARAGPSAWARLSLFGAPDVRPAGDVSVPDSR